jgi:hypothetical protein
MLEDSGCKFKLNFDGGGSQNSDLPEFNLISICSEKKS